jgi:hypothetical protein
LQSVAGAINMGIIKPVSRSCEVAKTIMATSSPGRPSASCSAHWESWHVTNPAEAEEIGAQVYFPNRLVAFDRHAVDFSLTALTIGPVVLGELSYGTEIRMDCRSLDSGYQLNLSRNGFVDARNGSQTSLITPGTGAVFNPEGTTELRRWSAQAVVVGLKIDRDYLQVQAEALLGRQLNTLVRFSMPFSERSSDHSAVTGAIEYGLDLLHNRPSPTVTAAIGPRLAEIITHGLLMSQPEQHFRASAHPIPSWLSSPYPDGAAGHPRGPGPSLDRRRTCEQGQHEPPNPSDCLQTGNRAHRFPIHPGGASRPSTPTAT